MMNTHHSAQRLACERLFAEALKPVARELRLVDLDALLHHVKAGEHASISDLVASSAELHFRPGTLTFALAADARASWDNGGCVSLDLEFCENDFTAFLRLTLGTRAAAVELLGLHAPGARGDVERRVARALAAARRSSAGALGKAPDKPVPGE